MKKKIKTGNRKRKKKPVGHRHIRTTKSDVLPKFFLVNILGIKIVTSVIILSWKNWSSLI
jgi:hypothetical protein